MKKKIIVHVEDYFDPNAGYQINDFLVNTPKFYNVIVICSYDMSPFHKTYNRQDDIDFEVKYDVKIIRLKHLFKISTRIFYGKLFKTIKKLSPDLLYLHGIADFKDLILIFKKRDYIIIRDCHMSKVATKNKFSRIFYFLYSFFFSNLINKTDKYSNIIALGTEEYNYLKKIGINDKKIYYLYHGYSKNIMFYSESEAMKFKQNLKIPFNNILISYVGKHDFRKRPDIIFDILNHLNENDSHLLENVSLLFIGNFEKKYKTFFYEKLNKISNRIQVIIDKAYPFNELYKVYSATYICIFPKETTLSSIHSQVCGCEVIMENELSNQERVINKTLYSKDDYHQASKILKTLLVKYKNSYRNPHSNKLAFREYESQVNNLLKFIKF